MTATRSPCPFPFNGGPGTCPGRELVLFTASTVLGKLLRRHDFRLSAPALRPEALPAALNPFAVRFAVSAR